MNAVQFIKFSFIVVQCKGKLQTPPLPPSLLVFVKVRANVTGVLKVEESTPVMVYELTLINHKTAQRNGQQV